MRIQDVKGNGLAKWAIEAALIGNHKLVIIDMMGSQADDLMMAAMSLAKASGIELDIASVKPCPCGAYGHPMHECSCFMEEIKLHAEETRKIIEGANIIVQAEKGRFHNGETEDAVLQRIVSRKIFRSAHPTFPMDKGMETMVQSAVDQGWSRSKIEALTPTLATMDATYYWPVLTAIKLTEVPSPWFKKTLADPHPTH